MKLPWALLSSLTLLLTGPSGLGPAEAATVSTTESAAGSALTSSSVHAPQAFFWQLTTPQSVVPGTVLLARAERAPEGTRSDDQFFSISRTGSNDVPSAALRAYHHAAEVMARSDPGCQVSWTMLAAIGRVESNHGRFGGSQLGADGVSRPEIRGPRLDGAGAFAAIRDTDHGRLDRDPLWDRAVGQMQFLPETWAAVARDGDGDGQRNPDDIDDSALGAAVYLCGAGGSLADRAGMARAAFRYNHSDYYVDLVLSYQTGYTTGVFALPSPPPPVVTTTATRSVRATPTRPRSTPKSPADHPAVRPHHAPATPPRPHPTTQPTQKPPASPRPPQAPQPPKPPKPQPTPKPTSGPTGPTLVALSGTWNACAGGFCLGSTPLDLGPAGVLADHAHADFDGDGTVRTNLEELTGLVGKRVDLQVARTPGGVVVYVIGNDGYRNADGSFARVVAAVAPTGAASTTP